MEDFSGCDPSEYNNAIKAYLAFAGRLASEWEEQRHLPTSSLFRTQKFGRPGSILHLTWNRRWQRIPILGTCRMRCIASVETWRANCEVAYLCYRIVQLTPLNSQVKRIKSPLERQNFIQKIRQRTNILYPWGRTAKADASLLTLQRHDAGLEKRVITSSWRRQLEQAGEVFQGRR